MALSYKKYPFTKKLGWSISRYEIFQTCPRKYYYTYYPRFVSDVSPAMVKQLKALTTVPLEIGNTFHDLIEAFLRRLQKNDSQIDEARFYEYGKKLALSYIESKTFLEVYYKKTNSVDTEFVFQRVETLIRNFLQSPVFQWICMKAITHKDDWVIEPEGYGETRLGGDLKAYCKMDFLFPLEDETVILDWKTGKRDEYKHRSQLIGYAYAAAENFGLNKQRIFPKIVYLYPEFSEFEIQIQPDDYEQFIENARRQTEQMQSMCIDPENNIPREIEAFVKMPSAAACKNCNFQQLCFNGPYPEQGVVF